MCGCSLNKIEHKIYKPSKQFTIKKTRSNKRRRKIYK